MAIVAQAIARLGASTCLLAAVPIIFAQGSAICRRRQVNLPRLIQCGKRGVTAMKVAKVFIAALLANGAAHAASLEDVQGDVWVDREKGFTAVPGPADVSPGDKVKIGSKSLARIVYPDGCKVALRANSLTTVGEYSPCSFRAQEGGSDQQHGSCEGIECLGPPALVAGDVGAAVGATLASTRGASGNQVFPLLLLALKPASP